MLADEVGKVGLSDDEVGKVGLSADEVGKVGLSAYKADGWECQPRLAMSLSAVVVA